jgi:hypothetical protein
MVSASCSLSLSAVDEEARDLISMPRFTGKLSEFEDFVTAMRVREPLRKAPRISSSSRLMRQLILF